MTMRDDEAERRRAELSRPVTAPDFLLSRATGSIRTQGSAAALDSADAASTALYDREIEMVVGAIPFTIGAPPALTVPQRIIRTTGPLEPPAFYRGTHLRGRIVAESPTRAEHRARIAGVIAALRTGGPLRKVVLARAVDLELPEPVDPLAIAARLIDRSPDGDGFHVDLSPAGPAYRGRAFVGSTPELLVRVDRGEVTSHPLAGSAPRDPDPLTDRRAAEDLLASTKNLDEHAYVTDAIREALTPVCSELSVPGTPELTSTREMWHLGTPIRGRLRVDVSALELALLLHPTPAICGTPTEEAADVIATVEGDRGFYSGAVGWCDASGNGEYMVAIRCAEVSADRLRARAWAGGGLVAGSDPDDELAETDAKLRTILGVFG